MAKKSKAEAAVAAETVIDAGDPAEVMVEEPIEPVTSDDRGDPAGRRLAEAGSAESAEPPLTPEPKPIPVWKPGSCINCGEATSEAVQVIAVERYRCTRCKHEWTRADEQAPFRRLAR